MKYIFCTTAILMLAGCSSQPHSVAVNAANVTTNAEQADCQGSTALPAALADKFVAIEDAALLQQTLGASNEGKLCQGQVYQLKADTEIVLYRAWNSTNPRSQLGNWWAFTQPEGASSQYRQDYEICYQWSPLDRMSRCTLKANSKVVVGNGQSATCSEYLTYPTSAAQQVYIADAAAVISQCQNYVDHFNWQLQP